VSYCPAAWAVGWRVVVAGLVVVAASAQASTWGDGGERFTVSEDGQEVRDNKSRLIWRRCVQGMNWNGRTCVGVPAELDFAQAQALATAEAKASQLRWRLPHVPELRMLMLYQPSDGKGTLVDEQVFPATPATWHWTASSTVLGGGNFNQYSYDNIAQNRTPGTVNRTQFLHGWAIHFGSGEAVGNIKKRSPLLVRLVRPDL
jgi:hypothetical protein